MSWQATKNYAVEDVSPISRTNSSEVPKDDRRNGSVKGEQVSVVSSWKIGWQTPTLLLSCYTLALIFAIAHLVFFKLIHGKDASGPNEVIPQSYVTTISAILSNGFGFSLRASLALAFVQYMWYLLRTSTMKVSTIELLFVIRTNVFMLFHGAVIKAAPVLVILAMFMWAIQVVTGFPPGAITVSLAQRINYDTVTVPTFDASFMGNGSGVEASQFSLANLFVADTGGGFVALAGDQGTKHRSLLPRLSYPVLVKGEAFADTSPCGLNCSYTITFEGPSFTCTNTSTTFQNKSDLWEIYRGEWFDKRDPFFAPDKNSVTEYSVSHFNATTLTPLEKNSTSEELLVRRDKLTCRPGRSRFEVTNTFVNNVQTRSVKSTPIERLISLQPRTRGGMVIVPGFSSKQGYGYGTDPAQWSENALKFYRDLNHMTIIGSMLSKLVGNVLARSVLAEDIIRLDGGVVPVLNPADNFEESRKSRIDKDVVWDQRVFANAASECPGVNVSVIDSTRFNANFGAYKASLPANPDIRVTEALLNEHLLNITLSMMSAFGTWTTNANATKINTITVYNFSSPLNLILPYFVSLFIALPFLALGLWALWRNGVSAIDSSFLQILMTTTGSAVLDRTAAGGCLGGDESVPQELKDLKIRFGEIVDRKEDGRVKRAGFGVDEEVTTLKRGDPYGVAKWI